MTPEQSTMYLIYSPIAEEALTRRRKDNPDPCKIDDIANRNRYRLLGVIGELVMAQNFLQINTCVSQPLALGHFSFDCEIASEVTAHFRPQGHGRVAESSVESLSCREPDYSTQMRAEFQEGQHTACEIHAANT
jgi:hypothetical protein